VYSCASRLGHPGVGPEHSHLKDTGRVCYVTASDDECRDAFFALSRKEGIIPALESAHAVAHALITAPEMGMGTVLVNLSGRGDKDMDYVIEIWGIGQDSQPVDAYFACSNQPEAVPKASRKSRAPGSGVMAVAPRKLRLRASNHASLCLAHPDRSCESSWHEPTPAVA